MHDLSVEWFHKCFHSVFRGPGQHFSIGRSREICGLFWKFCILIRNMNTYGVNLIQMQNFHGILFLCSSCGDNKNYLCAVIGGSGGAPRNLENLFKIWSSNTITQVQNNINKKLINRFFLSQILYSGIGTQSSLR